MITLFGSISSLEQTFDLLLSALILFYWILSEEQMFKLGIFFVLISELFIF